MVEENSMQVHDVEEAKDIEENIKLISSNNNHNNNFEVHFVLIHGMGGGAWCWYKIKSMLESSGYRVTCLDLKGAGIDQNDPSKVLSFDEYNKPLLDFLSSLHENNERVILVGHSAGGLSLSDAIHRFGKKKMIKLAVYVAATMLKSGYITDEDVKHGVPDLSDFGNLEDIYDIGFGRGHDCPPTSLFIKKEFQRKIIYHMSPTEDSTLASMLLRPGPIQALTTAKFEENADDTIDDDVPRIYIKTTHDHVVKPHQQESMIKKWKPSVVYAIETDHTPFFSAPSQLFALLVKAAVTFGY